MKTKQSGLELILFTFAMIFTILSISAYSVAVAFDVAPSFRTPLPWLILVAISLTITGFAWYKRRRV